MMDDSETETESKPNGDGLALSKDFDFQPATRLVYGPGVVSRVGQLAVESGVKRALIVTDPGIRAAGHARSAEQALLAAGVSVLIFDGVEENPTSRHVRACVDAARRFGCDGFVAVGGGSSMDCAKGTNFVLSNGGEIADYWGVGKATKPMAPTIAVPTTAGTGSEAQSFALIADEHTHQKMACGDKKALCKAAVLDPNVTVSQPPMVTAVVGIDAIAHAIESFVCLKRNALSCSYALSAWSLLSQNFPKVLKNPTDLSARGAMLLGAHFAGSAIEMSMLGAAHAAANPLTARFGVTHGVAVGIMLPWVLRYNSVIVDDWYGLVPVNELGLTQTRGNFGEQLAGLIGSYLKLANLPTRLRDAGVPETDFASILPKLADEAAQQWTAGFNPRPIAASDFADLYRSAH